MNFLNPIKTGEASWDFYVTERDEFLGTLSLVDFDSEKRSCAITWQMGEADCSFEEYLEAFRFATEFALFVLNLTKVNVVGEVEDDITQELFIALGYLVGRQYSAGKTRMQRFSCDRYDLVIAEAQALMGVHLDTDKWSFAFDSAKKRLGACKWESHEISLSRYFVDFHSLDEIRQVLLHEIAHALAGSNAGHSKKWKDIATKIGYRHEKISGEEIGNATAKFVGTCPNGHKAFRHRKPKTELSCSRCARRFDRRFLITWVSR
jgi:predicted SprT family Zn-dependent metalloprotease